MIEIIKRWTETDPLTHIGYAAGYCWGADVSNDNENRRRGINCMKSGHLRTAEYPNLEFVVSKVSARVVREIYTHIIGVTRLQESTRYVDCSNVGYFIPMGLTEEQQKKYIENMDLIFSKYTNLRDMEISKEDAANILPLGMNTKFVWKINLRALIHFMEMRLCNRAYKEIRQISAEIKKVVSEYSEEWKWIADNYFVPSCKTRGYCIEAQCCGVAPKGLDGLKKLVITDFLIYQSKIDNMGQPTVLSNKTIDLIDEFLKNSDRR